MNETIRSFVAIELPPEIKSKLSVTQQSLIDKGVADVKWVSPESCHLTLKFLGNVSKSLLPEITHAMRNASTGKKSFELSIRGLGVFPSYRRPRVIWVGIEGETDLLIALQESVDSDLEGLGFAKESRRFTPHLTLGRVKESANAFQKARIGEMIKSEQPVEMGKFTVTQINLMKSTLTPKGAIYERLESVMLD